MDIIEVLSRLTGEWQNRHKSKRF